MSKSYETCTLTIEGQVATVAIIPPTSLTGGTADLHWDLGEIFSDLRGDTNVRVVVLTGTDDEFYVLASVEFYDVAANREYATDPARAWKTFMGIVRLHQAMASLKKPIVGKVNGDALGFGSSLRLDGHRIAAGWPRTRRPSTSTWTWASTARAPASASDGLPAARLSRS